jgi:hypothetical protein
MLEYLEHGSRSITISRAASQPITIPSAVFRQAIDVTHGVIDQFRDFGVDVFSILGMRNLSAFVGELFAAGAIKASNELFRKNPHQDGYPDLLLMDELGQRLWASLASQSREKSPFSPFAAGGIEIKATCGSVPTPEQCRKRGGEKPDIGDQRIGWLTGYDWKAHHRETNNLCGLLWDFIDGVPRIIAVFYSHELTTEDWGRIVQPKEGAGRTTSVSIMSRPGIKRMYDGWLFVHKEQRYIDFIDRYNAANQLFRWRQECPK